MADFHFNLFREIIDYSPATRQRLISVLSMLKPFDCCGFEKRRFGRSFDGGYVMANDFDGVIAAYSLGINDDVSWDIDIANLGIDIHQYDHTIEKLPEKHSRFNWEKIGISHIDPKDQSMQTLDQILSRNAHDKSTDLILKCDIEGAEWQVFSCATTGVMKRFRQIVIEIHALQEISSIKGAEIIRRAILNMTACHHVIHVHANNWAPWTILGSIPIPTTLELTLLRKDRGVFVPSTVYFPTDLDMPNNPERPDFPLGQFRF